MNLAEMREHHSAVLNSFKVGGRPSSADLLPMTDFWSSVTSTARRDQTRRVARLALRTSNLVGHSADVSSLRPPAVVAALFIDDMARLARCAPVLGRGGSPAFDLLPPHDRLLLAVLTWLTSAGDGQRPRREKLGIFVYRIASHELDPDNADQREALGEVLSATVSLHMSPRRGMLPEGRDIALDLAAATGIREIELWTRGMLRSAARLLASGDFK